MNDHGLTFEWDESNRKHIAKHGVTPEEAEQVIEGEALDIDLQMAGEPENEERLLQVGQTEKGRILQVVTTWRGGKARVISAWDAPKQLKLYYLAEMRHRNGTLEDSEISE